MKTKKAAGKALALVASAGVWCGLNLHGQTADFSPTIYVANFGNNTISEMNGAGATVGTISSSLFNGLQELVFDRNGNLYAANWYTGTISEVTPGGNISTFAAGFNYPGGIAFDKSGNLYVANGGNGVISKVTPDGNVSTFVTGLSSPRGLAFDSHGNLYVAGGSTVSEVTPGGGISTFATGFIAANGLAFDSGGNLYVANQNGFLISKVSPGGSVSTFASGIVQPVGLMFDSSSNLYVTSLFNDAPISQITPGGLVSTFATGFDWPVGLALWPPLPPVILFQPQSVAVTNGATASFNVSVISAALPLSFHWQFNGTNLMDGGTISGSATTNLVFTQVTTNNVGSYDLVVTNAWGSVTSQIATLTLLFPPSVITPPASQTVLAGSNVTFSVAVGGTGPFSYQWQFNGTNLTNDIIITVAGNGTAAFSGDNGAATNANLQYPFGVAVDGLGQLYIADTDNDRIRKVNSNGIIATVAGGGSGGDGGAATNASLDYPEGVAVDASGNLYIADTDNQRIRKVGTNGIITTVAGNGSSGYSGDGGAATNASLDYPEGVAVDASGNLYIADSDNNRIRKVDTNGIISTVAGDGEEGYSGDGGAATNASLQLPVDVAVDVFNNLYIADYDNQRIREVDTNGVITTVAGNGTNGYSGDGGAATNANLYYPEGVATDSTGNLYVADSYNQRIREVLLYAGHPTLTLSDVGANNASNYTVVVSSPYGSVTSAVATLTVVYPPSILVQPASQEILPGNNATLSVTATGTPPLYYSWFFDATNLLQAGTSASLIVSNLTAGPLGQYTVVITNAYGSETSQVATLAFLPSVTTQPASQTVLAGTDVTLSVAVSGTGPFTYQWELNGTNLPNIITTVAGNGVATYAGDGGPATNASLHLPSGVAFDAVGNLYIADYYGNNRIRKVDTNGIITTVAGNGTPSYAGDGGPATNASLNGPCGVALDALGSIYIADTYNQRIRKVEVNGIITTLAGTGTAGFSGDGGAATNANFYQPDGVALDTSGNLYIADSRNQRIREVGTNGIITTVAGDGNDTYAGDGSAATNASLDYPYGVAVDALGNLYIADFDNQRIREVDTNGIITTVAGNGTATYAGDGGPATNASLHGPCGVALDALGNLYIADTYNQRIRKVAANGIITTLAGTGTAGFSGDGGAATNAGLFQPKGLALDTLGNLYIADETNNRVRKVLLNAWYPTLSLAKVGAINAGNYTVVVTSPYGSVTSAVAALTVLCPPSIVVQPISQAILPGSNATLSVTAAGTPPLYYSWYFDATNLIQSGWSSALTVQDFSTNDVGNYTVVVTNAYGSVNSQIAALTVGYAPSVASQPVNKAVLLGSNVTFSVAVGGTGPFSYQWQFNGTNLPNIITTVAGNGVATYAGDGGPATKARLYLPSGVAFDAVGNLYIGDTCNNRVRKVGTNGIITTVAGTGNWGYSGDGRAATTASLNYPNGVAVDAWGNLYIGDTYNQRIRKVGTNGIITTVAGNGTLGYSGDGGAATNANLYRPGGVALDTSGNLYIADNGNYRIRRVDTNGIITTVAGNGNWGYSGDGGAATSASLYYPNGVALDASGSLYIADYSNNRIRRVDTNGIISTFAGNGGAGYSGDGGPATNASLYYPFGVAVDALGNLYIGDTYNNRVRIVNTNGVIATVAGNGIEGYSGDGGAAINARLSCPSGVVLDSLGDLYIADEANNRIRKVPLASFPTFTLSNVGTNNAGNYDVVITSPYGSVTSAVVTLTVVLSPPEIITCDGFSAC
jgi:sugar lactone lactonase YvrE